MPVCCAGKRWVFARRRPATGLPPLPWSLLAPLTWHSSSLSPRRLEALRQLVPHTERANTANFLEEVVLYVQRLQVRLGHGGWHSCSCCTMGRLCGGSLHRPFQVACRCPLNSRAPLFRVCSAVQRRVVDLERQLGLAPTVQLSSKVITFSGEARGALKGVVCDCFSMPCGLYVQCGTDANPGSALAGLGAAPGTAPAYVPVAAQLTAGAFSAPTLSPAEDGTTEQTMLTAGNSDRRAAQSLVQPAQMPLLPLPPAPAPAQMPLLPLPPLPPAQPTLADPAAVQAALAAVLQQHTTQTLQQTLPPALQAQIHQILVQHHAAAAAGAAAAAAVPLHGTAFSQFNLKLQPPPSQVNTQQASQSLAVPPPPAGGGQHRTASGGAPADSQPSQANRPGATPAQSSGSGGSGRQSLQLLADSLGALSAGDASLRSVSLPSKLPLGSAGEAAKGGSPAAKRAIVDGSGIPTDEELAQLHRDLTAGELAQPQVGGWVRWAGGSRGGDHCSSFGGVALCSLVSAQAGARGPCCLCMLCSRCA